MENRLRRLPFILLIALLAGGGYYFYQNYTRNATLTRPLTASGTIEARQVNIASEMSGRIIKIGPDQGQSVKTGDILVQLDESTLRSQLEQAKSAVLTAQANYDLLAAGPTAEQVRAAQAAVDVAQAGVDRTTARARPEDVTAAQSAITASMAALSRAYDQTQKNADIAAAQAAVNAANASIARASDQTQRTADMAAARAAVKAAEENLRKLQTGPSAEDLSAVQAALQNSEATLKQAQFAYDNALRRDPAGIGASPAAQALEIATNNNKAARANYDKAAKSADVAQVSAAQQVLQTAQAQLARASDTTTERANIDAANQQLRAAQAQLSRASDKSADWANISAATQQLESAKANLARVQAPSREFDSNQVLAQLDQAKANLQSIKAGSRAEQLAVAKAQIATAQAQVNAVQVQIDKLTLKSPLDGVVLARASEVGEIVAPAGTIYQIGKLDTLEVTVYLPEEQIGLVAAGQSVSLHVDAFADQTFTATVLRVADKAEFTPRNVQTAEGRKDTVFAIKLSVENKQLQLKPGMPADVTFPRK